VDALYVTWGANYLGENVARMHLEEARRNSAVPPGITEPVLVEAMSRQLFQSLVDSLGTFAYHVAAYRRQWISSGRTPAVYIACDTGLDDSSACFAVVFAVVFACVCVRRVGAGGMSVPVVGLLSGAACMHILRALAAGAGRFTSLPG
jgi:hypothetical protein